jgi:hypothetical protein
MLPYDDDVNTRSVADVTYYGTEQQTSLRLAVTNKRHGYGRDVLVAPDKALVNRVLRNYADLLAKLGRPDDAMAIRGQDENHHDAILDAPIWKDRDRLWKLILPPESR